MYAGLTRATREELRRRGEGRALAGQKTVIVALHVAAGAATGALTRSRVAAVTLGPLLHVASDCVPHRHPASSELEVLAGIFVFGVVTGSRGALSAATLGAVAAAFPDLEHVVPALRARGAKVFHRLPGGDRDDATGVSARTQVALAVMLLAPVLCGRPNRKRRGLAGRVAAHGVPSRW